MYMGALTNKQYMYIYIVRFITLYTITDSRTNGPKLFTIHPRVHHNTTEWYD